MTLTAGTELSPAQVRQVKAMFTHRNTADHPFGWGCNGHNFNRPSTQTDAEWIAEHAFYVKRDGTLARRHAEPATLAEAAR